MQLNDTIGGPDELAKQFLNELTELVEGGEISADFAQRVIDDLFEPVTAGRAQRLQAWVWRAYFEEEEALLTVSRIRRNS